MRIFPLRLLLKYFSERVNISIYDTVYARDMPIPFLELIPIR